MSTMNRAMSKRRGLPKSQAIDGLPKISYYPPIVVTLLAALFVFVVVLILTLISFGNSLTQWDKAGSGQEGGSAAGVLFCGAMGIVGTLSSVYFLMAVIKGVRDLLTPVQYTRGSLADKRVIGGRLVGNWIGVAPDYLGPDLQQASLVTDEQITASIDRSQIVQPRGPVLPRPERKRSGYLSQDRISSGIVSDSRSTGRDGPRSVFRIDAPAYEVIEPGEEVLVAHSRFLEHIYYVAHLRNGEWVSFRNKTLI